MGAKLFQESELVKEYDENWKGSEEWALAPYTDAYTMRLARTLQVYHAGITIIAGNEPIGSGVLVKGAKGHGVLTAGHLCAALKEEIRQKRPLACVPQGTREPARPGDKSVVLVRFLPAVKMHRMYVDGNRVPDYGCIAVPAVDAPAMEAWGTFVNITRDGPSLKQKDYELNHNAWLAVGFLEERRPYAASVFHWNSIGAPKAVYERAGKRYLFIEAQRADKNLPKSLGGMSGSGLWEVPIAGRKDQDADSLEIGTPILRGIVFWQEAQEHQDDLLAFYAHELETIADDVVSWLDAEPF